MCCVDGEFWLVNSSFEYFPAVPLSHSRDLIHWEQVGNVLNRESQVNLKGATSWTGIYAPTIRYNNGTYYMITTNIGGKGNFLVTTKDPRGKWSEPIWLKQQGIDPSLYFENGHCYMVSNPNDAICLCEIDPATGAQLTESKMIWRGTGGRYPEGPHIYNKDGYYYLLISEGGTEYGHKLTIARSKNIDGPYEANPDNPILCHQRRITQSSQIQGTGHGDLVQAQDGSWWLVFLGFRTFGGNYHHLGRETFLAPVEWQKGGWPVVNGNGTVDTVMNVRTLSQTTAQQKSFKLDFTTTNKNISTIGPEWLFLQNPDTSRYELCSGRLRLYASPSSLTKNDKPTFIGIRQTSPVFSIETCLALKTSYRDAEAGLTVYQINDGHYDLNVSNVKGRLMLTCRCQIKDMIDEKQVALPCRRDRKKIFLRVRGDESKYYFEYSFDGEKYELLTTKSTCLLSSEVVGGFTGVVTGMYCTSAESLHKSSSTSSKTGSYADFYYFDYEEE